MGAKKGTTRVVCDNRRARFEYDLETPIEAGLVLLGSEVKSLRAGNAHLNDAFVGFMNGKLHLFKAHVAPFPQANQFNHEPDRPRPVLVHENDVERLRAAIRERGLTLVPLKLYFNGPWVKLEFAIGKGRKDHDKRHAIREREDKRDMARALAR